MPVLVISRFKYVLVHSLLVSDRKDFKVFSPSDRDRKFYHFSMFDLAVKRSR